MPGPADVLAAAGLFGPGSAVDRMLYRGGDVPGASGSAEHSDQVAGPLADRSICQRVSQSVPVAFS